MVRTSRLAAALVLAASLLSARTLAAPRDSSQATAAPGAVVSGVSPAIESGRLRWVRGMVSSVSADSLTLKLRNKELTIGLDAVASAPAAGSVVEAHYTDKKGVRRAMLIFAADPSAALSKRPATSYRGIVQRIKRGTVSLTANTKSHGIGLDKKTRLVDAGGRSIASGAKEISSALPAGEDVLVKYEDDSTAVGIGDGMAYLGGDKALEIRGLR